jgi:hypothetical protein
MMCVNDDLDFTGMKSLEILWCVRMMTWNLQEWSLARFYDVYEWWLGIYRNEVSQDTTYTSCVFNFWLGHICAHAHHANKLYGKQGDLVRFGFLIVNFPYLSADSIIFSINSIIRARSAYNQFSNLSQLLINKERNWQTEARNWQTEARNWQTS